MSSIGKSTASFLDPVANSIYPWFHGLISRSQAESILQHDPDGSFIVRFSESQPLKFTLTYVKVHASGRREMKNCLLQNIGQVGCCLLDRVPIRVLTRVIERIST